MDNQVARKIEKFFSKYPVKVYKKGQILIYRGEEPQAIYNIVSGRVKQYDVSDEGRSVIVNIYKPPNFFPMQWAITHKKNLYFFESLTSVQIRQAPPEEVVAFLKDNTDVLYNLLSRVYTGMEGLLRRMAHLMVSKASIRVLYELVTECKRFARKQKDGSFVIPMHSYELADVAGLSRETVSRELVKLKNEGLIEINRRNIIIKDLSALEKMLAQHL